jgi:hypothetical protein
LRGIYRNNWLLHTTGAKADELPFITGDAVLLGPERLWK